MVSKFLELLEIIQAHSQGKILRLALNEGGSLCGNMGGLYKKSEILHKAFDKKKIVLLAQMSQGKTCFESTRKQTMSVCSMCF